MEKSFSEQTGLFALLINTTYRLTLATVLILIFGSIYFYFANVGFDLLEKNLKGNGLIGLCLLFVSSFFMLTLFLSLPTFLTSILSQSFRRSVYSCLEFSIRLIFVAFFIYVLIFLFGIFGNRNFISIKNTTIAASATASILNGVMKLDFFEYLASEYADARGIYLYATVYLLYTLQLSFFLIRVHFKTKKPNIFLMFLLIISINILLSLCFYHFHQAIPNNFKDELFITTFWRATTVYTLETGLRILLSWGLYSLAAALLLIILPDKSGVNLVASPTYALKVKHKDI
jgi:hypothetical protein